MQAALIATRLADLIQREHDFEISRRIFWSDSEIVLHWIKKEPNEYRSFVANRLGEIREKTKMDEWRWVPSKDNPADDATRFVPEAIKNDSRWFRGPHFLKLNESQ